MQLAKAKQTQLVLFSIANWLLFITVMCCDVGYNMRIDIFLRYGYCNGK